MVIWVSNHIALIVEVFAVILGLIYVILAAKNKISCWIFGIIGSILSIYLFLFHAKLYAEAALYLFYVFAGCYGWLNWKKQKNTTSVFQQSIKIHVLILIGGSLLSFIVYYGLSHFLPTAQRPLIDSFTTVFSFIATYLTTKKWIENWIYWVLIDAVSTYLYFNRGLEIYAGLMLLYSIISVYGFLEWRNLKVEKNG